MDLAETMKNIVAKGIQTEMGPPFPGTGYITEKLYMLLQLYLQNKGWNPSVELLQCFTELKEAAMLPSGTVLQMIASRITLDGQGRLILRDNGKIILPYEHFANAVMLKHMNGPHGLHLGLENTIRAVMESYTIGRDCFGMEKDFIVDIVQNCPNPACRYFKNHPLDLPQKPMHLNAPTYIPESSGSSSQLTPAAQEAAANLLRSAAYPSSNLGADFGVPLPVHHPVDLATDTTNKKSLHKPQKHYEQMDPKLAEFLRANMENLEGLSSANKDLLALHNGAWTNIDVEKRLPSTSEVGQDKIIRAFSEIMKNMNRMKTCIRPAMCKPYGKQSEALQKTLVDTIQLVQSLRSFLPPPHIAVSSWKNEDKHRKGGMEDICDVTGRKIE